MPHDEAEGLWIGGMFWDGRATGWTLGIRSPSRPRVRS